MPYIKLELRSCLDKHIDNLCGAARDATTDFPQQRGGILNYIITRVALKFLGTPSYAALSQLKGAMTDAADEWYRRQMAPYEDLKIQENGDVVP